MVLYDFFYNLLMRSSACFTDPNFVLYFNEVKDEDGDSSHFSTGTGCFVCDSCCYAMLLMLVQITNSDECLFLCCVHGVHVMFFCTLVGPRWSKNNGL